MIGSSTVSAYLYILECLSPKFTLVKGRRFYPLLTHAVIYAITGVFGILEGGRLKRGPHSITSCQLACEDFLESFVIERVMSFQHNSMWYGMCKSLKVMRHSVEEKLNFNFYWFINIFRKYVSRNLLRELAGYTAFLWTRIENLLISVMSTICTIGMYLQSKREVTLRKYRRMYMKN